MRGYSLILGSVLGVLVTSVAHATPFNDVSSDLSNSFASPTVLPLTVGSNLVTGRTGTQAGIDRDYFTITVPNGFRLTAINLVSTDVPSLSFFGLENGAIFTNPATTAPAQLLGYVHFGQSLVGTNILDDMGAGSGAQGFTGPLAAGTYSFWLQENSTPVVNYQIDLILAAAPAAPAPALPPGVELFLAGGLALLGMTWLRRKGTPARMAT